MQAIRIAGPLKSRINRIAHAKAQRYALDEQSRLMTILQGRAATGATLDELHAHLDLIESGKGVANDTRT